MPWLAKHVARVRRQSVHVLDKHSQALRIVQVIVMRNGGAYRAPTAYFQYRAKQIRTQFLAFHDDKTRRRAGLDVRTLFSLCRLFVNARQD